MIARFSTAVLCVVVAVLARTWRVRVVGAEHVAALRRRHAPFVFALWHEHLLPIMWHHRGQPIALVISAHQDGQRLADAAARWGYNTIRGSSTRGGAAAYRQMLRHLAQAGEVAVTPDGPRGPRGVVKSGAVAAAQWAGVPIVPVLCSANRAWRLNTWDTFQIPKPFARVTVAYGSPVAVPPNTELGAAAAELERGMVPTIEPPC